MVTTPGLVMPGSALPCVFGMLPCRSRAGHAWNRCRCNAKRHTSLMRSSLAFRQVDARAMRRNHVNPLHSHAASMSGRGQAVHSIPGSPDTTKCVKVL